MTEFSDEVRERYRRIYGLAGRHSGVQICSWMRKALRGKGVCYKQKFYGVDCYRCCQMSPALAWCEENCVFCWRPMEWMKALAMDDVDPPEKIIEGCVQARRKLMSGIGGAEDADKEAFRRSFEGFPSHWAISLSGEPTLYPRIGELVKALRAREEVKSVFIVTNGQEPQRLSEMAYDGSLPTQLYVSLVACDEGLFRIINRPSYKDGWQRLNDTLGLLPSLDCRRVIRLTLIKGLNDAPELIPSFAELIERSKADFLEVKAYMFLGLSRQRLKKENMPRHAEVKAWSGQLDKRLENYDMIDEDEPSRIVLFKRKDSRYRNIIS